MTEMKDLTPVGQWKRLMCKQIEYRWGTCHTPDGPIDAGSDECDRCRYNYNNDYIDERVNK